MGGYVFGFVLLAVSAFMVRNGWREFNTPVDWSRKMAVGMMVAGGIGLAISGLVGFIVLKPAQPTPEEIAAEKEAACLADPACVAKRVAAKAEADRLALIAQQKAEALRLEQERVAAQAKAEKDAACRKDLTCWGTQNLVNAVGPCSTAIQKLAKFDYEWTDGFLEQKLSKFSWVDKEAGVVRYFGDKLKLQNGFGAWANVRYMCVYDPVKDTVGEIEVHPGRL